MTGSKTPNMTDYEAERRNFSLEVPDYFNFATDVVGKWAQDPHKLAMLWVGQNDEVEQVTFAQFAEHSSRAANAFASAGIVKGIGGTAGVLSELGKGDLLYLIV